MKRIESHRLGFKKIDRDSFDFLQNYLSRSDTTRYLTLGRPYTSAEVEGYIEKRMTHWHKYGFGMYLLYLRSTDDCIGYCGLEYANKTEYVDLRYGLVLKHWGKGFAKEAVLKCIEYGFTVLQLETIYGVAVQDNIASIAVLLKAGLQEVDNVNFYEENVKYFCIRQADWQKLIDNGTLQTY